MATASKYETKKAPKGIATLVAEREALRSSAAAMNARVAEIDAELEKKAEPGVIYDTPTHTFLRRPSHRFDAKKFAEAYPVAKKPKLYKRTLDTDAVKRAFSAVELAKFETIGYSTIVAPKEA